MKRALQKPKAVIVDVDGTLVDVSGVRHYVMGDRYKKDFQHFHAGAALCPPIESTLERVRWHEGQGTIILIVTARMRMWEFQTRRWLRKWDVPFHRLHMRANFDERRDVEVKREILAEIRENFDVIEAIDDNPSVIALWQGEGIPTIVVPGWVEDVA
jgi:FMN phosphatase YigB (HAD superfamily)